MPRRPNRAFAASWLGMALGALAGCAGGVRPSGEASDGRLHHRPPEEDVIYFVLADRFENADPSNDRGGQEGGRLDHGFDPAHKGFYHGGDLKGLTRRLDYVAALGANAIWLGPIYENKPVQGPPGRESAGYHGYWIVDFTAVDPHLGTREDLKVLVDAAHARGMKVYLDIITNHTADVIHYEECHGANAPAALRAAGACPYRSTLDHPYTGADGAKNKGFLGGRPPHQTAANFSKLTDADYAYTPYVEPGEEAAKTPAWLNDVTLYHNRGDSFWEGENAVYGDFAGLDDLFTENPRVRDGFIEIYKAWITDLRVDGFRIDTAKHVNPEFWPAFNDAMIAHAASLGIEHFHIFGEVFDGDPRELARFTREQGFPAVLDFGFHFAVRDVVAAGAPSERLAALFRADALYEGGAAAMRAAPTFVGNHDIGRLAHLVKAASPEAGEAEVLAKTRLAHALMFLARGVPVIYYGDEQGFVGDGGDQDAREDMFASRTAVYNDNALIGTDATTADENFDLDHPLFQDIAAFADWRRTHPALVRGAQMTRLSETDGGVFVFSRVSEGDAQEIVAAFNFSGEARTVRFPVQAHGGGWTSLSGACRESSIAPGVYEASVPARDFVLCKTTLETPGR